MSDEIEVSVRFTDRTMQTVNSLVEKNSQFSSKRTFLSYAVSCNIGYLQSQIEGQKSIRQFASYVNQDIDWVEIDIGDFRINTKLIQTGNLRESPTKLDLNEKTEKLLRQVSSYSNLSRSQVVRLCVIRALYDVYGDFYSDVQAGKELRDYENVSDLNSGNIRLVEQRWMDLRKKIQNELPAVTFKLYQELCDDSIIEYARRKSEMTVTLQLMNHYEEFQGSTGYNKLQETEHGREIIDQLETVVDICESEIRPLL
jgi:hypothetical protein